MKVPPLRSKTRTLHSPDDFLVEAICDCSSSGLVDNTENGKTDGGSSILSRLSLRVVKVSGHGYDGVGNGATEVSSFLHL